MAPTKCAQAPRENENRSPSDKNARDTGIEHEAAVLPRQQAADDDGGRKNEIGARARWRP